MTRDEVDAKVKAQAVVRAGDHQWLRPMFEAWLRRRWAPGEATR